MKAYSQDLRYRVIKAYSEDGLKPAKIAESFRICPDTVYDCVKCKLKRDHLRSLKLHHYC